jgi:hypothetical protein
MIYTAEYNCRWCVHYRGDRTCLAFPKRIPDDIWRGDNLHREPVDGDNGYRFEKKRLEIPLLDD